MHNLWHKIKTFLCCGEEEDEERPVLVIVGYTLLLTDHELTDASTQQGEPFAFKHVNVDLAGLTEQESVSLP